MGSPWEVVYPPLAASCLASKTGNTPSDNRRAYVPQVQAIRSTVLHEVLKA
jgi:hypothetical protein